MPLHCKSCGAPLVLYEGRDYFVCDYCSTYQFPQDTTEGIGMMGEEGKYPCPVCKIKLEVGSIGGTRIEVCRNCRGVLSNMNSFMIMITYIRSIIEGPELPFQKMDKTQLDRQLFCPGCRKQMSTHPYLGAGNVVIDNCIKCDLVWLDHGELTRILLSGPRTERGRRRL